MLVWHHFGELVVAMWLCCVVVVFSAEEVLLLVLLLGCPCCLSVGTFCISMLFFSAGHLLTLLRSAASAAVLPEHASSVCVLLTLWHLVCSGEFFCT